MKHRIAHNRSQSNKTRTFSMIFIYIIQITDVISVLKKGGMSLINTHLITCLREANKEHKLIY